MARLTLVAVVLLALSACVHAQWTLLDVMLNRMRAVSQQVLGHVEELYPHAAPSDTVAAWMEAGVETLRHPAFPTYQLRVAQETQPEPFCDPDVTQIKGYLDIRDGVHLWFIMYESRSNPATDPLVLWLNGGPGCSSSTGMLFELGPCWVSDGGNATAYNEHAWNSQANLLFLDQPVGVGYSYSDTDEVVDTSDKSAEDVYAFLQLFFARFPKYAALPFTVAAESYGGHYAPHIGAEIHRRNQELATTPPTGVPAAVPIRLASLMIGNGLTDPLVQFPSTVEYACSPENKYHLFEPDSDVCQSLEGKAHICTTLIDLCDQMDSRMTCLPAALYCWGSLYAPAQDTGRNMYDLRRQCDREKDGQLCYPEMGHIETLLNDPGNKKALGVPKHVEFQSCNMDINAKFLLQGDSVKNSAALLQPLLEAGVRVLAYAGEADFMCNAIGIEQWVTRFPNVYHDEIANATQTPLYTHSKNGNKPRAAGYVIKAGSGAGQLAFAWIRHAGHMVPHDQPAVALRLLNRWLANEDLTL